MLNLSRYGEIVSSHISVEPISPLCPIPMFPPAAFTRHTEFRPGAPDVTYSTVVKHGHFSNMMVDFMSVSFV